MFALSKAFVKKYATLASVHSSNMVSPVSKQFEVACVTVPGNVPTRSIGNGRNN